MRHRPPFTMIVVAWAFAACAPANDLVAPSCTASGGLQLSFATDSASLRVAETRSLLVTMRNACGDPLSFDSAQAAVNAVPPLDKVFAWLTSSGVSVRGLDTGSVRVRVSVGDDSARLRIVVTPPLPAYSITVHRDNPLDIGVGQRFSLTATVRDSLNGVLPFRWAPYTWTSLSDSLRMEGPDEFRALYAGTFSARAQSGSIQAIQLFRAIRRAVIRVDIASPRRLLVGDTVYAQAVGLVWPVGAPNYLPVREGADEWKSGDSTVLSIVMQPTGDASLIAKRPGHVLLSARMDSVWSWHTQPNVEVVPVPTPLPPVRSISSRCAVTSAALRVVCWGWGTLPVYIQSAEGFLEVSSSSHHDCGIRADSTAACWGSNFDGSLGNGTTASASTPTAVAGGRRFRSIETGGNNSCAIDFGDDAWCWGGNTLGQLGSGFRSALSSVPLRVLGGHRFEQLSVGGSNTCGARIDGMLVCWGYLGSNLADTVPVALTTFPRAVAVAVGGELKLRCLLGTDSNVWCWRDFSAAPTRVNGLDGASAIAVADTSVCALRDGVPWCAVEQRRFEYTSGWGTPTMVPVVRPFVTLIARSDFTKEHFCGRDVDGLAWCWGQNARLELGDGSDVSRPRPVRVASPNPP